MRWSTSFWMSVAHTAVTIAIMAICVASSASGAPPWDVRADGEISLKRNSNLQLVDDNAFGSKDDELTEVHGSLSARGHLAGWRVDSQVSGLGNLHHTHSGENWYFARSRLGLQRGLGAGTAEISNETRSYALPDRNEFDFLRNVLQLSYRHSLAEDRWQLRGGYANIHTRYPNRSVFNYTVHGTLLEIRRRWGYDLTGFAQEDIQRYVGSATPSELVASPRDGQRYGLRLGGDGLFAGRHSLSIIYTFQSDEADLGVKRIGDPDNPESTQDIEAEFDLDKHKVAIHYGVPLSKRWLFSNYTEWIKKNFDNEIDVADPFRGRRDTLLLSTLHLRYKLNSTWSVKLRYLYRSNDANIARSDYTAHLISIGLHWQR